MGRSNKQAKTADLRNIPLLIITILVEPLIAGNISSYLGHHIIAHYIYAWEGTYMHILTSHTGKIPGVMDDYPKRTA